ncbi:MAG: DUF2182 domain-containing protein [Pyrinomonadaceae bacterium]|nr:DUF2182 domain-containing protein [Pyrinomonadaceae bacterium]
MAATSERSSVRFETWIIISVLVIITALSWLYLFDMAAEMSAGGMKMPMEIPVWTPRYFLLMFVMWSVMMAGMMTPIVSPTVLIYAAVARKAARQNSPVAPTLIFVFGYLFIWTVFSLGATIAQFALDQAALLSPMMVSTSSWLGASLLIAAGVYQFLPIKKKCLSRCRSPVDFIARNWQKGHFGAFGMGIKHGVFCLGCCWVLMLLLFVGGVMNLLWIALIAAFVLVEKLLPGGDTGGRIVGVLMIVSGIIFVLYAGT